MCPVVINSEIDVMQLQSQGITKIAGKPLEVRRGKEGVPTDFRGSTALLIQYHNSRHLASQTVRQYMYVF